MKLVLVKWTDSMGSSAWEHLNGRNPNPPADCQTVGWLISDKETFVEVALTLAERGGEQEQACHIMCIPRCSILSITDVPTANLGVDNS